MRLDGRAIAVTGAAQGLGRAIAERLLGLGAKVAALDVDVAGCETLAGDVLPLACDVTDEASVEAAAEAFGTVDGLVNNAGVVSWAPLEDLTLEAWERTLGVNLTGTFLCTKHFGRRMLARGSGSIVNIASIAAALPQPRGGAYSATKAGVEILAQQTAVEWGPRGVRANTVAPGMLATAMSTAAGDPALMAERERHVASRRIGDPAEVADVVAFLLGDAARYVNGDTIRVDGGMTRMGIELIPRPGAG